jgi:hypothetical protein
MNPVEKARKVGLLFITLYAIFKTKENEERELAGEWADPVAAEKAINLTLRLMRRASSVLSSMRQYPSPGKF